MKQKLFNRRLFSYVILALLFLSLIPLFPSVDATTTSLTLGITANGSVITLPDCTGGKEHYDCINQNDNEFIGTTSGSYTYDTFAVTDHTYQFGTIINVTIKGRYHSDGGHGKGKSVVYIGGSPYYGTEFSITYTGYSTTAGWHNTSFTTNPATTNPWTWAEIDSTQYGIALKHDGTPDFVVCFYLYIEVYYTPSLSVTTSSITSVTETTATLNGVSTGADSMTCGFWYNTTGTNTNVTCAGTYNNGIAFSKAVTDLKPGYYYNVTAWSTKAGIGTFYSSTILHFIAKPYAPSLTHSVVSVNNINISWTNFTKGGITTRYTMVRYSTVAYPTTITSGTLLINTTTVNKTIISDYTAATYYFSYWTFVYQGSYNAWSTTYNTSLLVAPTKPSNLAVTSFTNNSIFLSWNKGTGDTVVVRNATAYPGTPYLGTQIYNGSLELFNDTGLLPSHKYYYRAWNWNGTAYSPGYTNVSQYTRPNKPYTLNYHITGGQLNISWLNGTGSQRTIIRKSTTAQPLLPTDGTELYNGTLHYKIDTTLSTNNYYTLFSYNTTTNLYSAYAPLTWYAVVINCYNESSGLTIAGYNVFFTNPDGTDTYEATGCTNPYLVNVSDIPQGNGISILVNATGYYARTYVKNIAISGNYYFSAYLIPISTATLYYLRVIGETTAPIDGATVTVKRYINATVGYQTISTLITDANGYTNIMLIPYIQYKVFCSKTGYADAISDYIPAPPNEWGQTVEKIFMLYFSATTPDMWDHVTYMIGPDIFDHNTSFNVYFNISCPTGILEWFKMTVTQYNITTNTWVTLWSFNETTMPTGGNLSYNINANGTYGVQYSFRITGYDSYNFTTRIYTLSISNGTSAKQTDIDTKITRVAGKSPVWVGNYIAGYTSLAIASVITFGLFTFSPKFSGFGLIVVGMVVAWMKGPLNVISNATIGWNVVVILVILGILVIAWTNMKERGE